MRTIFLLAAVIFQFTLFSQSRESVFVYFDLDKHEISRATQARLDSLTDSLDLKDQIELHGHCDHSGSDGYNNRLSVRRVKTVESYLLNNGWEKKDILLTSAHGEKNPLNQNATDWERKLNRRVEIRIWRGTGTGSQQQAKLPGPNDNSVKQKIDSTVKAGDKIILKNIHFVGARHQLLPESMPVLDELLAAMKKFPRLVISIEGHICCVPAPADVLDLDTGEKNLSQARAKAIMGYLIENGIAPARISYKGFGHSRPIYAYPEEDEEQMKLNRRVEIRIVSN